MFGFLDSITWRIGAYIAGGLAALLFLGFATQTIRIEGFNVWPIKVVGFKEEVKTLKYDLQTIKSMQAAAREKAEAERLRIEAEYREQAEKIDEQYQDRLADANARADAYARRMRTKAPGGLPGRPAQGAKGDAAEGADGSGETTFVAVSRADFDILNENTIRLQQAREWALKINEVTE